MNSFRIEEIYADGYERWGKVKVCSSNVVNLVHFIEYDEYIEKGATTNKRKKDDIINGTMRIDLITKYKIVDDNRSGFVQSIDNSSNITAIGRVKEIEDSDTLICSINNLGEDIIAEFENDVDINVGKTLEINGSLELDIE